MKCSKINDVVLRTRRFTDELSVHQPAESCESSVSMISNLRCQTVSESTSSSFQCPEELQLGDAFTARTVFHCTQTFSSLMLISECPWTQQHNNIKKPRWIFSAECSFNSWFSLWLAAADDGWLRLNTDTICCFRSTWRRRCLLSADTGSANRRRPWVWVQRLSTRSFLCVLRLQRAGGVVHSRTLQHSESLEC